MEAQSTHMTEASRLLDRVKEENVSLDDLPDLAIQLASSLLQEGARVQTLAEANRARQLAAMMDDPCGKIFTSSMADQCFRTQNNRRLADQLIYLLDSLGVPTYLSPLKRFGLQLFAQVGKPLAPIMVPAMIHMLRKETKEVILPGESNTLSEHLRRRDNQGVRINLNHLGEAILGENEAAHRLQRYLDDLAKPEVGYVSVKISTLYSQINLLAWNETLEILSERLRSLYRAARKSSYIRSDGTKVQKFVNLDMEEYRDLHITVALFKKVLSEEEFKGFSAGIVLQGYLPDSYEIQKELTVWAINRVKNGGVPIKLRIVKGANLAMEKVEAALKGWQQTPYTTKLDVDANYKRMVQYGCIKEHARALHLGIASHNLFDISYAMLLRSYHGVEKDVCFEMLEGMADHLRRVIQSLSKDMVLYCPAAKKQEFQNAVAYLIRRLDENTAAENFLRHAFGLKEGTNSWIQQSELFKQSFERISLIESASRRKQNRLEESAYLSEEFRNEPDTDFSLPQNLVWASKIVQEWSQKQNSVLPIVVGGQEIVSEKKGIGVDPSSPHKTLYQYTLASVENVQQAFKSAVQSSWKETTVEHRSQIMAQAASLMRMSRADLIGAMMFDAGKTLSEADVEVSEAIDMVEYYRRSREELESHQDLQWSAKGVIAVIPPWNFPCAIPAGGIISALMGGNSVLFKPARDTVLIGWMLANIFWKAGVPKDALQFLTGSSSTIGDVLITDPRLNGVVLTGSTATGKHMLSLRPSLFLIAETGGKNAIIVTNMADRDAAIKDIIHSAFGHAGQKCSAASLLILDKEVYDDPHFFTQLRDAASSLAYGPSWRLSTKISPLIHSPEEDLLRGLTTLDAGETWLLQPKQDPENPNLWSPGIKCGVKENSFMHQTELFGPVLGVMRANDLEEAIHLANGTKYGLTSGIHTLDEREQEIWLQKIEAGNGYINRTITGAIVRRQPFGGCKESCIGPGAKAGGPNYLIHLMNAKQVAAPRFRDLLDDALKPLENVLQSMLSPDELSLWKTSAASYSFWQKVYKKDQDPSQVLGQDNFLRYLPQKRMTVRMQKQDSFLDLAKVCSAAIVCGVPLDISIPVNSSIDTSLFGSQISQIKESEEELIARLTIIQRLRMLSHPSEPLMKAAALAGCHICSMPVLDNGRVELLHYLREFAISNDYHRYGNLGKREAISSY